MSELLGKLIFVAVIPFCFACSSSAETGTKYEELPNFHQVNQRLYRGAQPKAGGIKRLAQLGIKTVVNLRADDERARAEAQEAESTGLRYFNVPFKNLGRPTDEQLQRVLVIIKSAENQPVFVHCKRGADRTGTVVAVYRIEHDRWTGVQAQKEANGYRMRFWQLGMKDYIHDYHRDRSPGRND